MNEKILLYGLAENETTMIKQCGLKIEFLCVNDYRDIIAFYAKISIINPSLLTDEEAVSLADFYREINPLSEHVILTADVPYFDNISGLDILPDFFEDSFERGYRNFKTSEGYTT